MSHGIAPVDPLSQNSSEASKQGFVNIAVIILIIAIVSLAGYLTITSKFLQPAPTPNPTPVPSPIPTPTPVVCTQDAKQCSDGSYVSRSGPNCEFAACPEIQPSPLPKPDGEPISLREGQRESSFLLEKIYPDYVTGLNFREYPIATDKGSPVTLRIGEIVSNGCTITLTLARIEGNTATFTKKTDFSRLCPICLAGDTLIDTLFGRVPVKYLWKGAPIWTSDKDGRRVAGIVTETAETPVPPTHSMVHLILDDGRELFASPGHPTIDRRTISELSRGDFYDGASILSAKRISYNQSATYDILPSGETGFYWANGILLGSTLDHK